MNAFPPAPELSDSLEWINAPAPTLRQMRGRVVLLGFWSAASTYCQNMLEDLRTVQGKHSDGVSVIGIHTPKFEAERVEDRVLKAINRTGIRFPVANDPGFVTWQHYGIRAWPSVAVIDPLGRLVEILVGDLRRDELDAIVVRLLDKAGERDQRVYEPVQPVLRPEPRMALSFPLGIAVTRDHLYVADSGHHRVLECTHEGRIQRQFGSGNPGFLDGGSAECSFQAPRGLALMKDTLFVADTGNHALRRVRLLDGDVDTLVGTGRAEQIDPAAQTFSTEVSLNSPWGIAGEFDRLYVAMAGMHQVFEFDLGARTMKPLAGSGQLALVDGSGVGAGFAQPAGLALVQQTLYVLDSAASAVRSLHLGTDAVHTLVGQGSYDFGDQDGTRAAARLQNPQALALDPRSPLLWIADTYNDAIKVLRLGGGDLRRFEINHRLHDPAAIACSPGKLWIANASAHEVIRVDLDGNAVRRLPVGE